MCDMYEDRQLEGIRPLVTAIYAAAKLPPPDPPGQDATAQLGQGTSEAGEQLGGVETESDDVDDDEDNGN